MTGKNRVEDSELKKKNIQPCHIDSLSSLKNWYYNRWKKLLIVRNIFLDSLEVSVGIPEIGLGSKLAISVEKSLNIGSASGTKTSDIQHWIAEYPTKIPAKSKYVTL